MNIRSASRDAFLDDGLQVPNDAVLRRLVQIEIPDFARSVIPLQSADLIGGDLLDPRASTQYAVDLRGRGQYRHELAILITALINQFVISVRIGYGDREIFIAQPQRNRFLLAKRVPIKTFE